MSEEKKKVVGKPFAVGNTLGGRTKGALNKTTKFSREVLTLALAGQEENIRQALEKLSKKNPEAYINAVAKLLNYAIPKLQSTEISSNGNAKIEITLDDSMSVDDLKRRMAEMEAEDADFEDIDGQD
tara:strand:- start:3826 stop:4206 length:381 start_codon:yes stop_codon:yes gene_type:complete